MQSDRPQTSHLLNKDIGCSVTLPPNTYNANEPIITECSAAEKCKMSLRLDTSNGDFFMPDHQSKIEICTWWIEHGFPVLPCYENSKYVLPGYGAYLTKFESVDAVQLFGFSNGWNVAVARAKGSIILDFDNLKLYDDWAASHAKIATTYTERTPRGGAHVFFFGSVPGGLVLVPGVEMKTICMVSPSRVDGKDYKRGAGEIIATDANEIFSSLSKPGTRTVYALEADQRRTQIKPMNMRGVIAQIKTHWDVLKVFSVYRPDLEFKIARGVAAARCPFHDDSHASLFVILDKQFWKCHACGAQGDVINLYARFEGIENEEAIRRMYKSMGVRS